MADRYWVGGSGNWTDNTNHWSATDGGAPGASVPSAADNANFTTLSNLTAYTLTFDAAATCLDLIVANPLAGAPTFTGSATLAISGSMTLVSGMVWTYTGAITLNRTSAGGTVTTAAVALSNDLTFNGAAGVWTLQDNLTTSAANSVKPVAGTFNSNAKTINAGFFDTSGRSSGVALTVTITSSTLNLSAAGASSAARALSWNMGFGVLTGFTRNFGSSTINLTGANVDFRGGNIATYATVVINGGGESLIEGSNTYVNLTVTGTTSFSRLKTSGNFTVSGTFTATGNSQNASRLLITANVLATANTITAAAVALTNVDFTSITGAGAATWSGTSLGNGGGNTNITFTTPVTRYWVGNGGNWSDTTHWSATTGGSTGATMPLCQDTANIDANSITLAGQTITANVPNYGIIDFTGVLNSPTFDSPSITETQHLIHGSMTTVAAMTWTGVGDWIWSNQTGTANLTTNGLSLNTSSVKMAAPGGTLSLADNLTVGGIVASQGTFTSNAKSLDITQFGFFSTGALTRVVTITNSAIRLRDPTTPTGFVWSFASSGLTLNSAGSTITIQRVVLGGTAVFAGGGLTYNNLTWADESSTAGLTFTGANTFGAFVVSPSASARTLTLPASTTTTVTSFNNALGGAGVLSIISSSSGTPATLSDSSGTNVVVNASIKDSTATGGATWFAVASTNVSGNSGWIFGGSGGGSGASRTGMGMSIGMSRVA